MTGDGTLSRFIADALNRRLPCGVLLSDDVRQEVAAVVVEALTQPDRLIIQTTLFGPGEC